MKTIKVEIPSDGSQPVVSVNGACGAECSDLTKDLERALGTVEDKTHTTDYYAAGAKREVRRGG